MVPAVLSHGFSLLSSPYHYAPQGSPKAFGSEGGRTRPPRVTDRRWAERMRRENVVTRGEEISETRRRKPGHYVPSLSYHIILFTKRYIKIILCEVISDERRLPVLPSSSSIRPSCRSFLSPLGRRPRPTTGGRWEPWRDRSNRAATEVRYGSVLVSLRSLYAPNRISPLIHIILFYYQRSP